MKSEGVKDPGGRSEAVERTRAAGRQREDAVKLEEAAKLYGADNARLESRMSVDGRTSTVGEREEEVEMERERERQRLTLVHFSAQPEPFLSLEIHLNNPSTLPYHARNTS